MALEDGKCPNCGGAIVLDATKETATCRYCGSRLIIKEAINRTRIDGIADFDTLLLSAQRAAVLDEDYDKARQIYRKALELRPDDYRVLWGIYLCEIDGILWAYSRKGFVQYPGDTPEKVREAIRKYALRAKEYAPDNVKEYYEEEIRKTVDAFRPRQTVPQEKKKGCYVATAVYGSYDCPDVWVLRRYRDEYLSRNVFGRIFIKLYYKISPLMIRLFGKTKAFNRFFKRMLDRKTLKLRKKGYLDTPYVDIGSDEHDL